MDFSYLQNLTPVAGMTPEQQRDYDNWKKSTDSRMNLKSVVDPMDAGLASQSYRSAVNSMGNNTGIASGFGTTGSTGTDAAGAKSWWGEAADWIGNENNSKLFNTVLNTAGLAAGLIGDMQVYEFNKSAKKKLDFDIGEAQRKANKSIDFSNKLAAAQSTQPTQLS